MKYIAHRLLAASLVAAFGTTAALAVEPPARIKKANKLVIATQPNYPPISYKDPASNKLMGFDVELGEAIAKEMGVPVEWQEIGFAQMLPSLTTGRVDIVMAGMSDLPARRETVDFVDYLRTGPQFYTTPAGAAAGIKAMADLCGKKVGASRSTNWPAQMTEWSKANCEGKGKPAITVVGTEGSVDARTQLKTGRLDAAVQGNETLPYFQKLEPNSYVLLGEPFAENLAGIPTTKADTATRDAVKAALDALRKSGTYEALLTKYNMRQNALPEFGINKGQ
jgi:polar amino acid transport system substrate-binding protein